MGGNGAKVEVEDLLVPPIISDMPIYEIDKSPMDGTRGSRTSEWAGVDAQWAGVGRTRGSEEGGEEAHSECGWAVQTRREKSVSERYEEGVCVRVSR